MVNKSTRYRAATSPSHLLLVLLAALAVLLALVGLAGCDTGAATKESGGNPSATGASADGPRLSFKERSHEFGKISAAKPMDYTFAFTNTGSQPLEITEVTPEPPRLGA